MSGHQCQCGSSWRISHIYLVYIACVPCVWLGRNGKEWCVITCGVHMIIASYSCSEQTRQGCEHRLEKGRIMEVSYEIMDTKLAYSARVD